MSEHISQKRTVMIPTVADYLRDKAIILTNPYNPAGEQLEEVHLPKPAGVPIFAFTIDGDDKRARSIVAIALNKGNARISNSVVRGLAVGLTLVEKEKDFQFLAFSDRCCGFGNRLIVANNGFPEEAFAIKDEENEEESWWHIFPLTRIGETLGNIAIGTSFIIVSAANDTPGMISATKTPTGWNILGYGGPVYRKFIKTAYIEAKNFNIVGTSSFYIKTIPVDEYNPEIHF